MHPKNIIIFCDGTWNRLDQKSKEGKICPTNVVKLFEAICPYDDNGITQFVHYVPGVGTSWRDRIKGGGFGYGISDNIKSGYKAICSNYEDGDRIFLFGFSRGAYTARSIAGLIHNLGIIRRVNIHKVHEAFKHYKNKAEEWKPGSEKSNQFQTAYCWPTKNIHFLGVWDTVGALGSPYGVVTRWIVNKLFNCGFHNISLSSSIQSASHAISIDEHRWPFRPTRWQLSSAHNNHKDDFEERWFPGVHSDVGGGYAETGLSDIALDWMACRVCLRGLNLDLDRVSLPIFDPNPTQTIHNSQTFLYRLATLAFVKIPSAIGIPLPGSDEDKQAITRITWKGDYRREIPPGTPTGHTPNKMRRCFPSE
ncbi:DUF2235 domain-containing protein [Desulfogranum marinum]|uniref:DUF2235 domain-containing protein n=1 Tax=Desulfogranum marinum TaxID=453220 RepID=UPI0029C665C5|nr:DUF2235 domain-containing protein [Desulfogranum marinum]